MNEDGKLTSTQFESAVRYQNLGDFSMAESLYRKILSTQPNHIPSIGNLAIVSQKLGKFDLSVKLLHKLTRLNPSDDNAYTTLGNLYYNRGKKKKAINYYLRAIRLNPKSASTYANLGLAYQEIGDIKEAMFFIHRGLQVDPEATDLHFCLANIYNLIGQFRKAVKSYATVIEIEPRHARAYCNLAISLKALKKYDLAIENIEYAIKIEPNRASFHYNLGNILKETGQYREAVKCHQTAIQLAPDFTEPYTNLGILLEDLGRFDEAIRYLTRALQLAPKDADTHYNLGNLFAEILEYEKSNRFYNTAIELNSKEAVSNYLMNLNYAEALDPNFVYDQHKTKAKKLETDESEDYAYHGNIVSKSSNQKIRIGYLSSDFRQHSVSYFLQSVIEYHDRNKFEIFCFYNSDIEDEITDRIRNWSDHFISVYHLPDHMAYHQIKKCDLNFLIELNGHTKGNRLTILHSDISEKILSWVGYPNTTGLSTVDYKITDNYCDPAPFADEFYVEDLLRFEQFFMVYDPPLFLPEIEPSPYITNGYLTFGSFNNFKKINPSLIDLWACVLNTFPDSKLLLKNSGKSNMRMNQNIIEHFQKANIDDSRINLFDRLENEKEHLSLYNLVDVSLDTHPYSGTATTFESLVMGVPVFTLTGEMHASRVTGSILHQLKLDHFVVIDRQDYVQQLKKNIYEQNSLDRSYRQKLLESDLCNGSDFTRKLERKLVQIMNPG